MKMAAFEYHRPASLDEALVVLAEHVDDVKVMAGGQSLVPVMAMRLATPAHVVDISRLPGVGDMTVVDGFVEIGCGVRQAAAETSATLARHVPLASRALPWIGHRAIRNRGTVCGSIAHADPAAELPSVAMALDAVMVAKSVRGTREIAAAEFFKGYLTTALADDELLTAVRFADAPDGTRTGAAVVEIARRHGDFALAGASVNLRFDAAGVIAHAAMAFFGVADVPVRVGAAEEVLTGTRPSTAVFAEAAALVSGALDPPGDDHASAAYRRHVAGVLARRGLATASADASVEVTA